MRLTRKREWPVLSAEEIKKRARILVVDDTAFLYLQLFQSEGYAIDKWDDVTDLDRLAQGAYDVILLDIHGVGRQFAQDEGLGILRYLRERNPTLLVIAYSNASFSLTSKQFFDLANRVLAKSADYVDFKRTVDELLKLRFSMDFYVDKVSQLVGSHIPNEQGRVRELAAKAILAGSDRRLRKFLIPRLDDPAVAAVALQVVQTAISILGTILGLRGPPQ